MGEKKGGGEEEEKKRERKEREGRRRTPERTRTQNSPSVESHIRRTSNFLERQMDVFGKKK